MNKRSLGSRYETQAAGLIIKKGYVLLERNYRCVFGEIDIIALDKETLVFIEVKYRKDDNIGYPEEAVPDRKRRRISKTADFYCMENDIKDDTGCRFDVIAIDERGIRHYENAFMYCGGRYR